MGCSEQIVDLNSDAVHFAFQHQYSGDVGHMHQGEGIVQLSSYSKRGDQRNLDHFGQNATTCLGWLRYDQGQFIADADTEGVGQFTTQHNTVPALSQVGK